MNKYIIIAILAIVIGAAGMYFLGPKRTSIVEKEVIKKDIVTVVKEVKRPDGTTETTTTTTDHSQQTNTNTSNFVADKKHDWNLRLLSEINNYDLSKIEYGIGVERRILGPFFAGAYAVTNKTVGVSIGCEF